MAYGPRSTQASYASELCKTKEENSHAPCKTEYQTQ